MPNPEYPGSYPPVLHAQSANQWGTALRLFLVLWFLFGWIGLTSLKEWRTPALEPVTFTRSDPSADPLTTYPWLYLRDDKSPAADEKLVELAVAGDVMLGRGVAGDVQALQNVAPWLAAADLTLGNLEGIFASRNETLPPQPSDPTQGPYRLDAPPAAVAVLQAAGFDLLGMANNHALDRGSLGLKETANTLRSAGIQVIGAGSTQPAAYRAVVRRVKGLRLAFLAFNMVSSPSDVSRPLDAQAGDAANDWRVADWEHEQALVAIRYAHSQNNIVIVSVHWGIEYENHADPWQSRLAQQMLAAGADLVVGHHPHVVQGTQVLESASPNVEQGHENSRVGFVAYSLGNFVFDQYEERTRQGLALRAFFDPQGLRAVQALPVWAGPRPRLASSQDAAWLEAVYPPPRQLAFTCSQQDCSRLPGTAVEASGCASQQSGIFWAGQIDLTGDGQSELVRRQGDGLLIYQGGELAWQSPSEWQVQDAALGDPNDDGRYEVMTALHKMNTQADWLIERVPTQGLIPMPDLQFPASQPFIIGYRGGVYRMLWGGSPVVNPIREVEVGDVNGDGLQELVVIEERDNDLQAVTVWRWHGWGFSLLWRSAEARYQNLTLSPSAGKEMLICVGKVW